MGALLANEQVAGGEPPEREEHTKGRHGECGGHGPNDLLQHMYGGGAHTEDSKDPGWGKWIMTDVVEHVDIDLEDGSTIAEGKNKVRSLLRGASRLAAAPLDTLMEEGASEPPHDSLPPPRRR